MKKFRVIEVRKTINDENFIVESVHLAENFRELRNYIDNQKTAIVVDKSYRIKEIE